MYAVIQVIHLSGSGEIQRGAISTTSACGSATVVFDGQQGAETVRHLAVPGIRGVWGYHSTSIDDDQIVAMPCLRLRPDSTTPDS